ncbi:hypothetical protein ACQEVZ_29930 [Dactylosporangium sp. CA-152071]|uniref:hypothetical protein n=1 Tax=Dactylosporangium sp. CA-152071 TaxID=3239933 RepID=UPI003D8AA430
MDNAELVRRFHADMVQGIRTLSQQIGYRAPRFAQMVSEHGGIEAARRLLRGPGTSEGFLTLYQHNKLGMSVEAWVLRPEYAPLFTEDERAVAHRRLTDHQFDVDRYLRSLPTA